MGRGEDVAREETGSHCPLDEVKAPPPVPLCRGLANAQRGAGVMTQLFPVSLWGAVTPARA